MEMRKIKKTFFMSDFMPLMKTKQLSLLQKNVRAFTLLELLIALALIMVVVSGITYGFVSIANTRLCASRMMYASYLAQNKLEEFKSVDYLSPLLTDNITNWIDSNGDGIPDNDSDGDGISDFYDCDSVADYSDPNNPLNAKGESAVAGDVQFTRVWNIVDDTPDTGMKTITLIVSFPSTFITSATDSITITTIMADY